MVRIVLGLVVNIVKLMYNILFGIVIVFVKYLIMILYFL